MKRLLQISLDTLLTSMLPIIMWVLLGFIVTKDIANVFSLTYPLQFFYMIFASLFAVGPNITAKKIKDNRVIYSNMLLGTILVGILTAMLSLNADSYIRLMNMSPDIYHNFCIYSMIWMYINFMMQLIVQKLYYEGKNRESNKINLILNLSNFISIISLSILIEETWAIAITLLLDFIIVIVLLLKNFTYKKFSLKIKENIHYTSFSLLRNIGMFLTYSIGFKNSFSYGPQYTTAINFESLTTDTQWDMLYSIDTAAKIDFAEGKFDYRESLKNGYKLIGILIGSTVVMNLTLYWYFKPDLRILSILLAVQIVDMLVDPLKTLRWDYLQINDNEKKHNISYIIPRIVRIVCSFIPSAFCTYIGQFLSMVYLYAYAKIQCRNVKAFKLK